MGASAEEYQGFRRAVEAALEKERQLRKQKGPEITVEFIALIMIPGKAYKVQERNFATFERIITEYHASFPSMPIHLLSVTEAR